MENWLSHPRRRRGPADEKVAQENLCNALRSGGDHTYSPSRWAPPPRPSGHPATTTRRTRTTTHFIVTATKRDRDHEDWLCTRADRSQRYGFS